MKKIFAMLLLAVLCLSLAACGAKEESVKSSGGNADAASQPAAAELPEYVPMDWSGVAENNFSDFLFTETNTGEIIITGYVGGKDVVKVPELIDGKPVITIDESAFAGNGTVTHVCLPDTVGTLKRECFEGCANLVEVCAPSVMSIDQKVFADCSGLRALTICASAYSISGNAFNGCAKLDTLAFAELPEDYVGFKNVNISAAFENGVLYTVNNSDTGMIVKAIRMLPGVAADEVALRADTTIITHSCFYGCNFRSITIPASVTQIEGNAFAGTHNTESVSVEAGSQLNQIEQHTFGINSIKTIDLSAVSVTIDLFSDAFSGANELTKVVLPDSVKADETAAEMFAGAESVTVTYRGADYTFDKLSELVFEK